jgi:hypothetical protein
MIIIGLILQIVGTGILVRSACTPLAARIRLEQKKENKIKGNCYQKIIFRIALIFGSKDPLDIESSVVEQFKHQIFGFILLLLGVLLQVIEIILGKQF